MLEPFIVHDVHSIPGKQQCSPLVYMQSCGEWNILQKLYAYYVSFCYCCWCAVLICSTNILIRTLYAYATDPCLIGWPDIRDCTVYVVWSNSLGILQLTTYPPLSSLICGLAQVHSSSLQDWDKSLFMLDAIEVVLNLKHKARSWMSDVEDCKSGTCFWTSSN